MLFQKSVLITSWVINNFTVKEHNTVKISENVSFFYHLHLYYIYLIISKSSPLSFSFKQLHHHISSPSTDLPQNPDLQYVGRLTILSIHVWEDAQKQDSHKGAQQQPICPHSPHKHQKHTWNREDCYLYLMSTLQSNYYQINKGLINKDCWETLIHFCTNNFKKLFKH